MSCTNCKNINFDNCPTFQDLLLTPHLDFYYEEFEGEITGIPDGNTLSDTDDNLMAVIHCYHCGTTYKANGEVIKGGNIKDEIKDYDGEYNKENLQK